MSFAESACNGSTSVKLDLLRCLDGSKPSILLAEDSPAARVLTGALLRRIGCEVDEAENGEEALSFIKNSDYDLVLMDIEMPVMDGVVAAREIRALGGSTSKTPIVALSAFLADTKKSAFWQKYFDIAISKPVDKHQLHATINQVLEQNSSQTKWKSLKVVNFDQPEIGQTNFSKVHVEQNKLALILHNVPETAKASLLNTASVEILTYAKELSVFKDGNDEPAMARALHQLCGLSANFAACALHDMVKELRENLSKGIKTNLDRQVLEVCQCAEKTVLILQKNLHPEMELAI